MARRGSSSKLWLHDSGSATILAVSLMLFSIGAFAATQVLAIGLISQRRVEALADEIAIAADDSLRGLATGIPCDVARQLAGLNMAFIDECRIVGFEAFVKVHIQSMGIVLSADAKAGPSN